MIAWFERHNRISWVLTILIATLIFYFSSLTFPSQPSTGVNLSPIVYHVTIFFFFAFFLIISVIKGQSKNKRLFLIVLLIAISYGALDEIHQLFTPGRNSSFSDFLTDSTGVLFAGLFYFLEKFRGFKKPKDRYYKKIKDEVLK